MDDDPQNHRLAPETKRLLGSVSTATLQSQLFKRGLRNTFMYGVRPLTADHANFVGTATTCRFIPAREDIDTVQIFEDPDYAQRKVIDHVEPDQVLVFDGRGDKRAAVCGEILATRMQVRGVSAFVTDASVRDSYRIAEIGMPVYVGDVSAATNLTLHHAVDIDVPIGCAGVAVYPNDVIVGDREGVIVIPRELADEVAADAIEQELMEEFLRQRVADGAPLRGTYPPGPDVRAEWLAHRTATQRSAQ